ncbi:MAG: TlpA disulfide reductase family protein [Candidatus Zixiibacteriota bacterium]
MRKDFIIVFGFALLAIFMISCSSSSDKTGGASATTTITTTAVAGLSTLTAYDLDGNTHSFGEYVGKKPLIVNFWGTWCPPCKREMPDLKKIYDEYRGKGLEIVGLVVRSTPQQVKDFTAQYGYDWPMMMADAQSARLFGLGSGVPFTVFVDRNGKVLSETFTGARTYNDFKRMVEQII